jgi:uncharacterized protein (TIGR02246 family)
MRIQIQLLATVGLAIGFALPAFAQQKDLEKKTGVLAMEYDAAVNKRDASAIAALYTDDAIWSTFNEGAFQGRQAIANEYQTLYFKHWKIHNYVTTVRQVTATGRVVRSTGTWSCVSDEGGGRNVNGNYSWVLVDENGRLRIRRDRH